MLDLLNAQTQKDARPLERDVVWRLNWHRIVFKLPNIELIAGSGRVNSLTSNISYYMSDKVARHNWLKRKGKYLVMMCIASLPESELQRTLSSSSTHSTADSANDGASLEDLLGASRYKTLVKDSDFLIEQVLAGDKAIVQREVYTIGLRVAKDRATAKRWLHSWRPRLTKRDKVAEGLQVVSEEENVENTLRNALREIASHLPDDFDKRQSTLVRLSETFREEIAAIIQKPLNEKMRSMPHDDLEAKQQLSRWANSFLRPFGLAFRCPNTKRPSVLHADPGRHPRIGRFQLESVDDAGRFVRAFSSNELPELELVPDDLSRAQRSRWAGRSR